MKNALQVVAPTQVAAPIHVNEWQVNWFIQVGDFLQVADHLHVGLPRHETVWHVGLPAQVTVPHVLLPAQVA